MRADFPPITAAVCRATDLYTNLKIMRLIFYVVFLVICMRGCRFCNKIEGCTYKTGFEGPSPGNFYVPIFAFSESIHGLYVFNFMKINVPCAPLKNLRLCLQENFTFPVIFGLMD